MKIYLNQYNTATDRNLLPLSAGLIRSFALNDPSLSDCQIEIEMLRSDPEWTVKQFSNPNILAFSCYMWNIRHSLEVARLSKIKFPQSIIIVGGPSIPRKIGPLKDFFANHTYIDIAVHGEGEITFTETLKAIKQGLSLELIPGISYRHPELAEGFKRNLDRSRIHDLDSLPSPFLDGTFDELLKRHGSLITGATWETNRGCPFQCTFCDWGQATQAKVTTYSQDRLFKELDWISRNKIFYVYAADANFGIKKRDTDIAKYMAKLKKENGYPGYFMINWLKNSHQKTIEIADILREGGIGCQVTLSMQSFDDNTLNAIKRSNIHLDTFRSLKAEYNRRNIPTYSELMLGLPGESYSSFSTGVVRAISPYPRDHFVVYLARILENAEMAEPEYIEKYGIKTRLCEVAFPRRLNISAPISELEEIIVATEAMDVNDWRKAFNFGYLASALYNARLCNVVINFLRYHFDISVKKYIEFLIDNSHSYPMTEAMLSVLNTYQESILNGKTSVLTLDGFGDRYWEPHEAAFLAAIKDCSLFYKNLKSLTLKYLIETTPNKIDLELIEELFTFQSLVSPINYHNEEKVENFANDWLEFYNKMHLEKENQIIRKPTKILFQPLDMIKKSPEEFAISQLTAVNTGNGFGCTVFYISEEVILNK